MGKEMCINKLGLSAGCGRSNRRKRMDPMEPMKEKEEKEEKEEMEEEKRKQVTTTPLLLPLTLRRRLWGWRRWTL